MPEDGDTEGLEAGVVPRFHVVIEPLDPSEVTATVERPALKSGADVELGGDLEPVPPTRPSMPSVPPPAELDTDAELIEIESIAAPAPSSFGWLQSPRPSTPEPPSSGASRSSMPLPPASSRVSRSSMPPPLPSSSSRAARSSIAPPLPPASSRVSRSSMPPPLPPASSRVSRPSMPPPLPPASSRVSRPSMLPPPTLPPAPNSSMPPPGTPRASWSSLLPPATPGASWSSLSPDRLPASASRPPLHESSFATTPRSAFAPVGLPGALPPPTPSVSPVAMSVSLGYRARSVAPPAFRRQSGQRPSALVHALVVAVLGAAALATVVGILASSARGRSGASALVERVKGHSQREEPNVASTAAPAPEAPSPPSPVVAPAVPVAMASATPPLLVAVEALPKFVVEPDMSLVTLPASARGHRVFVDGRVVNSGAAQFRTKCGVHKVQIGSRGKPRVATLPCGGEIALD